MLTQVRESFVGFDGSVTSVEEIDVCFGVCPRVQEQECIVKHSGCFARLSEESHKFKFGGAG